MSKAVESGSYWPFLKKLEVYRCPAHMTMERPSFGAGRTHQIRRYLMNGAINSFGRPGGGRRGV